MTVNIEYLRECGSSIGAVSKELEENISELGCVCSRLDESAEGVKGLPELRMRMRACASNLESFLDKIRVMAEAVANIARIYDMTEEKNIAEIEEVDRNSAAQITAINIGDVLPIDFSF